MSKQTATPVVPGAALAALEGEFLSPIRAKDRARWLEHETILAEAGVDVVAVLTERTDRFSLSHAMRPGATDEKDSLFHHADRLTSLYHFYTDIQQRWDLWEDLPAAELQRRMQILRRRSDQIDEAKQDFHRDAEAQYQREREIENTMRGLERTVQLQAQQLGASENGRVLGQAQSALKRLLRWKPEGVPAAVRKDMKACGETAVPPFVSEAFLYPLLGKEDARSLLGELRRLGQAIAVDIDR